jgi:hypothetical protein
MTRYGSKNIFTNTSNNGSNIKSIFNVPKPSLPDIPTEIIALLKDVERSYTKNLATKQYAKVPKDMIKYITLLFGLTSYQTTITKEYLQIFTTIAIEALRGSYNSALLFKENTELNLKVILLQNKINEILSNKNNIIVASNAKSTLGITKTFKLAPLYSCYIYLYGMPAYGVGFDPANLEIVKTIFDELKISYN